MNNRTLLEELQCLTIEELIKKIKAGDASAGDLGVARQLLKDNDIVCVADGVTSLEALTNQVLLLEPEDANEVRYGS